MKNFMDENFLLETETARRLYHETARDMPIFDYHCHLVPAQIANNTIFNTITAVWLGGDHYKWRMMRAMGFDEYYITGGASDYEKFYAWAKTAQELIGSPLYHWTHLELQRYFGINEPLSEANARVIWDACNAELPYLSVKNIFEKMNVYAVGTTDDPIDTLEYHKAIAEGTAPIGKITTKVLPSFRPDKALNIENPEFFSYIEKLELASGVAINSVTALYDALKKRVDYFAAHGCRASDHALEKPPCGVQSDAAIEKIFQAARAGNPLPPEDVSAYKAAVLSVLAEFYARHDMVMQLHFASIRNVNTRMFKLIGADTGYDAVHDMPISAPLAALLDRMEQKALPKTILYSLNPADYYPLATIMGGFQNNYAGKDTQGIKCKMQFGSAWWFCDHKRGMTQQIETLAELGMLSGFIGMLTDSRSFLSYPRHEYFRRILCNCIGSWVENGEYPLDNNALNNIISAICFTNAQSYFVA